MDTADQVWLGAGFLASLGKFPQRPALEIGDKVLSYAELAGRAAGIAAAFDPEPRSGPPLTALLAARSVPAYAGMLAALFRGNGYVPLNPGFPVTRLDYVLGHSGCREMIVDQGGEAVLDALLNSAANPMTVVLADRETVDDIALRHPRHDIRPGLATAPVPPAPAVAEDAIAYLLYTSGSTGWPKGVMVSHANVAHFLKVVTDRYSLNERDRFSQMFDLGFDLSVFDTFGAWQVGACVCCPSDAEQMLPDGFINRAGITVWFSVPSVAVLLNRLRKLQPGVFPNLRLSLFCGEALSASAARAWAEAAPGAILENLYGPTEVTLACTLYRWRGDEDVHGTVPIGEAFPGMTAAVVGPDLQEVPPGQEGELLMTGPQVALGYWQDREKTDAAFVNDPRTGERAYRTGDLVRRDAGDDATLIYLGRIDHQIKLHGHRIELGEVESALRSITGAEQAVVVGWPVTDEGVAGLAAFVETEDADTRDILAHLRQRLPAYMIPKTLRAEPRFPLTSNGKVDRAALIALLNDT